MDFTSLTFTDVTRTFGRRRALNRVTFECRAGEVVALFGPNGAGKSTLLSIAATLLEPSSGTVRCGDHNARRADASLRRRIGLLGHDLYMYPELSAAENLLFFGRLYAVPDLAQCVDAALDRAELTNRRDDPVAGFSRSMRQRLALERALLHDPHLVLLDEPFTGLDHAATAALGRRLAFLRANGTILLVTTHDLETIEPIVDRAVVLQNGRLAAIEPGARRTRECVRDRNDRRVGNASALCSHLSNQGSRTMARKTWRLVDELLLFLLFLLPLMLLLGRSEGTLDRATLLFWLLLILPVLILPWLWRGADPGERREAPMLAAQRVAHETTAAEEFGVLVAPVVNVRRAYVEAGIPIVEGQLRHEPARAFSALEALLGPRQMTPLMEDQGEQNVRVIALPSAVDRELRRRPWVAVNVLLFLATAVTTVWAGALHQGINLLQRPGDFMVGVPYAVSLLAILGVHEFGHYAAGRWHRVDVTLPYFIPVPMGLGTFGAFIQIRSLIKSRRAVFDIGIAGPLAGLVIALPALYFGLRGTLPLAEGTHATGVQASSSILLALVYQLANGGDLGSAVIQLSPVAYAGWIGLFITALNLMPVGQLDGGHIAYGLFGQRRARMIGIGAFLTMAGVGMFVWPGLLTWALMIALIAGFSHMPALDDVTPPDATRFALGAVALAVLVLTTVPLPVAARGMMLDCPYL